MLLEKVGEYLQYEQNIRKGREFILKTPLQSVYFLFIRDCPMGIRVTFLRRKPAATEPRYPAMINSQHWRNFDRILPGQRLFTLP